MMSLFLNQCFTVDMYVQWEGFVRFALITLDILFLMQTGKTPMYFAAQYNHPRLVELLLAHGADINKVQHCVIIL